MGYSPCGHKESNTTECTHTHIYSSIKLKKKSLKNTILISDLSDLLSWVIYFSFFKFNFIFWHTEQLAGS